MKLTLITSQSIHVNEVNHHYSIGDESGKILYEAVYNEAEKPDSYELTLSIIKAFNQPKDNDNG